MTGAFVQTVRHLEVVLHRDEGLRVTVEPDVTDSRRGHQLQHPFQQTIARTQDRYQRELFSREKGGSRLGERGLYGPDFQSQLPHHLVAEQE